MSQTIQNLNYRSATIASRPRGLSKLPRSERDGGVQGREFAPGPTSPDPRAASASSAVGVWPAAGRKRNGLANRGAIRGRLTAHFIGPHSALICAIWGRIRAGNDFHTFVRPGVRRRLEGRRRKAAQPCRESRGVMERIMRADESLIVDKSGGKLSRGNGDGCARDGPSVLDVSRGGLVWPALSLCRLQAR